MPETWAELIAVAESLTTRGFMLIVIVGFIRGWLVPGHTHRQVIEAGEHWRTIALRATRLAGKGAGLPLDEQLDELIRTGGAS